MRSVDDLLLVLLEALLEIVGEVLIELLFGLAAEALSAAADCLKELSPVVSAVLLSLLGAAAGLLSCWLFPHRLIVMRPILPGVSLLLAPLATGFAMKFIGERMRQSGREPSGMATFRGGVLFAFSMALIRLWLVGWAR
jgi:hypothetical protein